jgi:hypothetical protein
MKDRRSFRNGGALFFTQLKAAPISDKMKQSNQTEVEHGWKKDGVFRKHPLTDKRRGQVQ